LMIVSQPVEPSRGQLVSWPVARATLRERALAPLTLALTALLVLASYVNAAGGWSGKLFSGAFGSLFFLAVTTGLGAGLVSAELESGHAQLALLRPLTRAAWYGGRLWGAGLALLGAVVLGWLAAGAAALARGGGLDLGWAASLPLSFVWAFAWLSLLACLSVV